MKSPARQAAAETVQLETNLSGGPTRRELLKTAALLAITADQAGGYLAELGMSIHPETRVYPHPTSEHTIIVMGGAGNDGFALSEMLLPVFGEYANILAVRYAETNINPMEIDEAIFNTMEQYGLHNPSWYLCSAAGQFAAYSIATHAASPERQAKFGRTRVVELHSAPTSEDDLLPAFRYVAESHTNDVISRSRAVNLGFRVLMNATIHDGGDTSVLTQEGIHNQLQALRDVDYRTGATQMDAIRDIELQPGYLRGAADRFVFIHPKQDEVINSDRALGNWRLICGSVEDVVDLYAPRDKPSHATNTFPQTLDAEFRRSLVH